MLTVGCRDLGAVRTNGRRPRTGWHIVLLQMVETAMCFSWGKKKFKEKLYSRHTVIFDCSQNLKVWESYFFKFKFENSQVSKMTKWQSSVSSMRGTESRIALLAFSGKLSFQETTSATFKTKCLTESQWKWEQEKHGWENGRTWWMSDHPNQETHQWWQGDRVVMESREVKTEKNDQVWRWREDEEFSLGNIICCILTRNSRNL